MSDSTIALLILGGVIVLFMVNRLPVGLVALAVPVVLWATDLMGLDEAFSGYGDPVIIFIAALFVVSDGIDSAGLTTWAGQQLSSIAGGGRGRLLVAVMALCAVMTALISLNGSVAALLPMGVALAVRAGLPPSGLLMPMVYAGSAGSLLVLAGSPVNIIVSNAADELGEGTFGYFEFAWLGVPILIATMVLGVLLAPKLLPARAPAGASRDLSRHAALLAEHYALDDGLARLRVRERSPLIGLTPDEIDLGHDSMRLVAVQRGIDPPALASGALQAGDVLVVSGPPDHLSRLAVDHLLAIAMKSPAGADAGRLVDREMGVAEVVVPPRSPLVGETVFPGMRRASDLVILAVQRRGRDTGLDPVELAPGDSLLVYGTWSSLASLVDDRTVLVVDSPELMRRQVPLGVKALEAGLVLVGMVVLLALGVVPPAIAGLLAAATMVLTGVISSHQAYRAVSWETIVLIGGLIPLSAAIQQSGAGDRIADAVLDVIGTGSPVLALAALFVLTAVLGLVISNTATVLIVLPVGLAVIEELDLNGKPVLMMLGVAASAALLTPVQTPGNMMIMAPGGYRFSDYARLGIPVMLMWLAVSLVVIPIIWPL